MPKRLTMTADDLLRAMTAISYYCDQPEIYESDPDLHDRMADTYNRIAKRLGYPDRIPPLPQGLRGE